MALQRAARIIDLAIVCITFLAAFAIALGSLTWPSFAELLLLRVKLVNLLVFCVYLAICSLVFSMCGFYLSHRLGRWSRRVHEIFLATTLITGVLFVLPLRMAFASAYFVVAFWVLTSTMLLLSRVTAYRLLYFARSRGRNLRNLVIVAEGGDGVALARRIETEPALGYRVLQVINAKET